MITIQGKGVSSGIALGRIVFFQRSNFIAEKKAVTDTAAEVERFKTACLSAAAQLDELATTTADNVGKKNAMLFEIHRMMLFDTDYTDPVIELIERQRVCAEYAVSESGGRLAQDFAEMDDEYMKERALDIRDVS
ncbi:MAG: phosphoenolpyruvate--protein phosphotransferase, partial [Spirochaetaceae bacterium]|nr:phosphoenolpyruvate--protein phosphotransferase [Spirochaetaceae bacterium]